MKTSPKRDEWLMREVAWGEREQLETLIRRYANPLLTFIQRMVGNRHRSEELFQEVFLTVWRKRHQYQSDRPFKPWLYAIAINQCRADFRYQSAHWTVSLDDDASPVLAAEDDSPVTTAVAAETAALVATAVDRLPEQQRAVVVLRVWGGLSYGEIAQVLGRSVETARSHMHYGLTAMREYLEPRMR